MIKNYMYEWAVLLTPLQIAVAKLDEQNMFVLTQEEKKLLSDHIDQLESENQKLRSKYSKLLLRQRGK